MLRAAIDNEHQIRMLPSQTTHETISTLSRGFRNEHTQTRIMSNCQLLKNFWTRCMELGRDEMRASVLWRTVWRISMEYHTLGKLATSSSYVEIM